MRVRAWSDPVPAATVHCLLDSLGSTALRRVVANQIDRCPLDTVETIRRQDAQTLFLSAKRGDGLRGLQNWLREQFFDPGAESEPDAGPPPEWPS